MTSPSTRLTLLARLRESSNDEAWRSFVDLYLPLLFRYCRARGLQEADACDVSQQVLAIVHKAIETFEYDPQRGKFRHWLGAITGHEIQRYQRKGRQPGRGAGDDVGGDIAQRASGPVDAAWLENFNEHVFTTALARVRPSFDDATWQAFDLSWIQDEKPQVVAAQLGKTAAWVYKARYRVLNRLRAEVEYLTDDAAVFHKPG
jgi:RNA polymerase sigma-70 factor (ECF subfamily)